MGAGKSSHGMASTVSPSATSWNMWGSCRRTLYIQRQSSSEDDKGQQRTARAARAAAAAAAAQQQQACAPGVPSARLPQAAPGGNNPAWTPLRPAALHWSEHNLGQRRPPPASQPPGPATRHPGGGSPAWHDGRASARTSRVRVHFFHHLPPHDYHRHRHRHHEPDGICIMNHHHLNIPEDSFKRLRRAGDEGQQLDQLDLFLPPCRVWPRPQPLPDLRPPRKYQVRLRCLSFQRPVIPEWRSCGRRIFGGPAIQASGPGTA